MPNWQIIVLGIVQGLTEFLPISSTAHLIVTQMLFGHSLEKIKESPYTVSIQLGTLIAVFLYFRKDIFRIGKAFYYDLYDNKVFDSSSQDGWLAKYVIIGTIPVGICGLLFQKKLKEHFYTPMSMGVVAIVFALLMLASELWSMWRVKKGIPFRSEQSITLKDAILIGIFQCFALMPGGSRSGTTITAGLLAGFDRGTAARFSFLLSLPAILAAGLKDIYDQRYAIMDGDNFKLLFTGIIVSCIVGYISIHWLLSFLKKYSSNWFVLYRVIFGLLLILCSQLGWLGK